MKYLILLMFILGGFLHQAQSQTVLDYNDYLIQLQSSGDPFQNSEAVRIVNYSTGLYPTMYFSDNGIYLSDGKNPKKMFSYIETLNTQGYEDVTLDGVEMIIVLVRKVELISSGQISDDLRSKMPNLKNIVIISEFSATPDQFAGVLPTNSSGIVSLHKVSFTQ